MACPALPTCGLALAESERVLPSIVTQIDAVLASLNLTDDPITIRMTGCPNGCARPYMGEIGIVGVSADRYTLYLGGNAASTRLNRVYREGVRGAEIADVLAPLFARWAVERTPGEEFGDFCLRAAWEKIAS
jgi:sulfite reductase beta subunit-like hemoprotein